MYSKILAFLKEKPPVYTPGTAPFWDDEHISKHMLQAHLDPNADAASRRLSFIEESADWISKACGVRPGMKLLDLGCGPGIYAEKLSEKGFRVTGVDFSRRSIQYAREHAAARRLDIQYEHRNYLEIDYEHEFDVATLIYCDFGVLPFADRRALLQKIRRALKEGGVLILDGFIENEVRDFQEKESVHYAPAGFWAPVPYVCIQRNFLYPETGNYLEQYVVVTENDCQCYNNWNQIFSAETLKAELAEAGFSCAALFGDVAGAPLSAQSNTLCAMARISQDNDYTK